MKKTVHVHCTVISEGTSHGYR